MGAYIVTEGDFDAELLTRLLDERTLGHAVIVAGGGYSSAVALASSLLSVRRQPVVLLLDAGTTSEEKIAEQRRVTEDLLSWAGPASLYRVVFAVPELETVFFHDPDALVVLLGVELTQDERVRAEFRPKEILRNLLSRSQVVRDRNTLLRRLDERAVERLARHPLVAELAELVQTMGDESAGSVASSAA